MEWPYVQGFDMTPPLFNFNRSNLQLIDEHFYTADYQTIR